MAKQQQFKDENGRPFSDIPQEVQDAADKYIDALRSSGKAKEKLNFSKESLLALMKTHKIKKVPIDEGNKMIVRESGESLKTKKIKREPEAAEESEE